MHLIREYWITEGADIGVLDYSKTENGLDISAHYQRVAPDRRRPLVKVTLRLFRDGNGSVWTALDRTGGEVGELAAIRILTDLAMTDIDLPPGDDPRGLTR